MENEVVEKKKGFSSKDLAVMFTVLVVLIVGLLVGLVLLNAMRNGIDDPIPEETEEGDIFGSEKLKEVSNQANLLPIGDAMNLYEETIDEANSDAEAGAAKVEYAGYLINNGELELALEQLEQVNEAVLEDWYKIAYNAKYRDYYSLIGDTEKSNEYNEKIGELTRGSEFETGG